MRRRGYRSHGCVNMSPADAETFYEMAVPGDPPPPPETAPIPLATSGPRPQPGWK